MLRRSRSISLLQPASRKVLHNRIKELLINLQFFVTNKEYAPQKSDSPSVLE